MPTLLTRATYSISDALIERMVVGPADLPAGLGRFRAVAAPAISITARWRSRASPATPPSASLVSAASPATSPNTPIPPRAPTPVPASTSPPAPWCISSIARTASASPGGRGQGGAGCTRSSCANSRRTSARRGAMATSSCPWRSSTPAASPTRRYRVRATHRGTVGLISSTVIDFRVGRLLGVAFVVSTGRPGTPRPDHRPRPRSGAADRLGYSRRLDPLSQSRPTAPCSRTCGRRPESCWLRHPSSKLGSIFSPFESPSTILLVQAKNGLKC